jgi:hypothetical protein
VGFRDDGLFFACSDAVMPLPRVCRNSATPHLSHTLGRARFAPTATQSFIEASHPLIPFDQQGLVALFFLSVVDNLSLNKEHITYGLFDLALLPPNAAIHKAMLRFFVQSVVQAGKLKIFIRRWFAHCRSWVSIRSAQAAFFPSLGSTRGTG